MLKLLVYLTIGFTSLHAFAGEKTLAIAVSEVPPFGYQEGKELKGINVDIFKALEKASGLTFHYDLMPHARALFSMKNHTHDLFIVFNITCDENSELYESQANLYDLAPALYLKSSAIGKNIVRIGKIIGTCSHVITDPDMKKNITEVERMDQAIEMLQLNRLDGICGLPPVVKYGLSTHKKLKEELKLVKSQRESTRIHSVLCRKKSLPDSIKKKLDSALKKIKIPKF